VTVDNLGPTVAMTAPPAGPVSGTAVTVTATATDNVGGSGVAGVQFLLDGVALGAEDTATPYTMTWNSTTTTNGAHTLSARARDVLGNLTTSAVVNVTVSNAAVLPTGAVAYYTFEEGAGTAVNDSAGDATVNNGTIVGTVSRVASRTGFGQALSFNGGRVDVPDAANLDFTAAFTVEAWVNVTTAGNWRTVVMKGRGAVNQLSYALYAQSGNTSPSGYMFNGADREVMGTAMSANAWHHLAVTLGGGTLTLYVDGTARATRTGLGSITGTNAAPLQIGNNTVYTGENLVGLIDEVAIYNRALTATEIAQRAAR
jgi:hypothetical protein